MEIEIGSRERHGSCNFCNRSSISSDGNYLKYDYQDVFKVTGNYIAISICLDCLDKLCSKKEEYDSERVANTLTEIKGEII